MDTLSLTKEARIYNGEKTISLTSGAGKTAQPLVKENNAVKDLPSAVKPGPKKAVGIGKATHFSIGQEGIMTTCYAIG